MGKTVLVTGATGFLACYVIDAYLKNGWNVKGTVRNESKAQFLLNRFPSGLELVTVKDLVTGEGLDEAVKGCDAIAHVASPYQLEYKDAMRDLIDPAVKGTKSVLEAAKKAGIKRVVITSSFAAITDFTKGGPFRDYTYTSEDWNPTTLEQACEPGRPGAFVYSASKTFADRSAHAFAKENDLVVCTINPPMIYGPPIQGVDTKGHINTSSNAVYALIHGDGGREIPWNRLPLFCHVRDVALAHVKASEADAKAVAGQRFILCGGSFLWEDAVRLLQKERPALADRLPAIGSEPDKDKQIARLDTTPAKEALGFKEFIDWKTTLLETIDALVELERKWQQ